MSDRRILSEPGVLFRREDCAGAWRRFVATLIDGTILLTASIVSSFAWWFVLLDLDLSTWFWFGSTALLVTLYLGPLKRSSWRTAGYRIAGIRVVSLDGGMPGHWAMFLRSTAGILWMRSPLFVVDVLWIGQDEQRRTLRDKLAGTIVVRSNAVPVATGVQTVVVYSFAGWMVYLREVKPLVAPATPLFA